LPSSTSPQIDPVSEYTRRLEARRSWLMESRRKTQIVSTLRLAAGLLVMVTAYFALALHQFSGWFILVPVAAYLGLVLYSQRVYHVNSAQSVPSVFTKGAWRGSRGNGSEPETPAQLTPTHPAFMQTISISSAKGLLFELLCTARTQAGQKYWPAGLSKPAARAEILHRQEATEELRNNVDLRKISPFSGAKCEVALNPEGIADWATAPSAWSPTAARVLAPILVAFSIAAFIYMWFFGGPPSLLW
jgi:hypothetical protein